MPFCFLDNIKKRLSIFLVQLLFKFIRGKLYGWLVMLITMTISMVCMADWIMLICCMCWPIVPFFLSWLLGAINSRRSPEAGVGGEEHGQGGQQQHQQQQPAPQRQVVVRRFQIAFQLDLLLILKLAAVIFLFNQDGSRQRLVVLVFFASLVYL